MLHAKEQALFLKTDKHRMPQINSEYNRGETALKGLYLKHYDLTQLYGLCVFVDSALRSPII